MARAIVAGITRDFGGAPSVGDDATNGWFARFDVSFVGAGVPGGFDQSVFEVHFLDSDGAVVMDNKIRDAARAEAVRIGLPGGSTLVVLSFAPPRRL